MTRVGNSVGRDVGDADLIALVAGWPTRMRQVFTLRKVYDLPPSDIARRLGLSDGEVERCLIAAALACAHHDFDGHPTDAEPHTGDPA
jgi:DNA-directed RNA polymerase specialized sigma24 family protein